MLTDVRVESVSGIDMGRFRSMIQRWSILFFFFQAEDGIRDLTVTGVQTCALPISLRAEGCAVSRRRVARLMRTAGLRARVVQIYRANPRLHRFYGQHPNRLGTRVATRPNRIWVGDITYLPVVGRWHFLAVVLDQYSRRVLAWALGPTRDARLTRTVLDAAVRRRRPRAGLVFHSDRDRKSVV